MKVAFISRATLFSVPGGDTRQMEMTAEYLRKAGIHVDILLANAQIDYAGYDLLHFFNITRPADILAHIKRSGKPYVVSTIFVEHGRINEAHKGMLFRTVSHILPLDAVAYLKSVARWVLNGEEVVSKSYFFLGQRQSIRRIAKRAAMLLPNSENEMRRFSKSYNIDQAYRVVPNGVDTGMLSKNVQKEPLYEGAVICLARFEPLKNQLALIQALNGTKYQVFLHGKPSPNNKAYYQQCIAAAAENIHIKEYLHGDDVYRVYASAKVHVLPSYFETTGLSSLEAAAMGCNIVVTEGGDTRDYFKDDAWYCNPDDVASIKAAVDAAYAAPYDTAFRERILRDFTWERAAEETLKAYKQVLKL